jgi:hypothetical protein
MIHPATLSIHGRRLATDPFFCAAAAFAACCAYAARGGAQSAPTTASASVAAPPATRPEAEPEPIGLTLGVGVESAYYFRGLNLFKGDSQRDMHGLFEPSLTYTLPGTGLSFGYWGGYQVNGENSSELIAAGIGHEQDVVVRYSGELANGLTLAGLVTAYIYPFADEQVAGTAVPTYLEPGVSLAYAGALDVALAVAYLAGIQGALEDGRYLYLNPTVGKRFDLSGVADLSMGVGFGFKLYNYPSRMPENRFDVRFDWAVPLDLGGGLGVTPGAHFGWTDLRDGALANGYVVWLSLASALAL